MSRIIKSFEEFNRLNERAEILNEDHLNEGFFGNLATKLKNGLSRALWGRISKLDAIYGTFGSNGKMSGVPNGELGKLEYDYIVSCVDLDEEILKKMAAQRQFANSSTQVPAEALIANNEFTKRTEQLRSANKKRYDARKAAILDKIDQIVGDKQRASVYSEAMAAQLSAGLAEMEYNLRKKFASDEQLEKLEDKLVQARQDAKKRVERLTSMLSQMGLANSQNAQAQAAPVSANQRQTVAPARGAGTGAQAPPPVAQHSYVV